MKLFSLRQLKIGKLNGSIKQKLILTDEVFDCTPEANMETESEYDFPQGLQKSVNQDIEFYMIFEKIPNEDITKVLKTYESQSQTYELPSSVYAATDKITTSEILS